MSILDEQFSYRGLVFGEGCDVMVNSWEGLEGFEARTADSEQPRGDGGIRGLDYMASRLVSFELSIIEKIDFDGSIYEELWRKVRSAFQISRADDFELAFKRPGMPERMIRCRPIQLMRSEKYLSFNRYGFPPVVLRAVDPRIYSTEIKSANATVYTVVSGGVELPAELPTEFGAGSQTELVVQNDGEANAFPLLRFYGPVSGTVTGVKLTNSTTGQVFEVSATISSGQILTADMEAAVTGADQLVVSLDGSSRYGDWELPRAPFFLAPGSNNLRFEVTGTSTNAICNVTWRDTWDG
ncbi:hypothetical protein GCM10017691_23810 [Pseudonocardia petroleophila]|uniref:Phage tail family protein n=1 Tax=Pseudonocardia petroleophila TaxID=37331 RepID=A0A7G7MFW2_9PSEU|nr:phage tail domain-containing protein [Pseudonocardia petroleophila]QNG51673.1 phage tail family protein [Pseudonocardia petroleophila]